MPLVAQHILVLLVAAGAGLVLVRQAIASVRGRGGKLGSCCAKGCDAQVKSQQPGERVAFIPVESLRRPRGS